MKETLLAIRPALFPPVLEVLPLHEVVLSASGIDLGCGVPHAYGDRELTNALSIHSTVHQCLKLHKRMCGQRCNTKGLASDKAACRL